MGPPPVASKTALAWTKRYPPFRMSISKTPAIPGLISSRDEGDGAVFLQALDVEAQDPLHQAVDDLDAGEIALVHRAVEALPGKGLLMQAAVGVAVEEAADLVFQLVDALDGPFAKPPG